MERQPIVSRAAFIDLDGTIVDSAPGIIAGVLEAYAAVGVTPPDEMTVRSWIGPPVLSTFERELGRRGHGVVQRANQAFRTYFDSIGRTQAQLFDGIVDALEAIAGSEMSIVVITQKPLPLAEDALETFGLAPFVEALYAPRASAPQEPKMALFDRALADLRPTSGVGAGDRASDVSAAARFGIATVGVTWGYGTRDELIGAGAVGLAAATTDLPELLFAHTASLMG